MGLRPYALADVESRLVPNMLCARNGDEAFPSDPIRAGSATSRLSSLNLFKNYA